MTPDERLRELAIRHAAFARLDRRRDGGKEIFSQEDTSGLTLAGETIRAHAYSGRHLETGTTTAALSVRTVHRPRAPTAPMTMPLASTVSIATKCAAMIRTTIRIGHYAKR